MVIWSLRIFMKQLFQDPGINYVHANDLPEWSLLKLWHMLSWLHVLTSARVKERITCFSSDCGRNYLVWSEKRGTRPVATYPSPATPNQLQLPHAGEVGRNEKIRTSPQEFQSRMKLSIKKCTVSSGLGKRSVLASQTRSGYCKLQYVSSEKDTQMDHWSRLCTI